MAGDVAQDRRIILQVSGPVGDLARQGHGGAALILIREWGGSQRYIPKAGLPTLSNVATLIGNEAAVALARICGGKRIDIPSRACIERTLKGDIQRAAGGTREVAQKYGVTERYVRLVRAAPDGSGEHWSRRRRSAPRDERQTDLIDWLGGNFSGGPGEST